MDLTKANLEAIERKFMARVAKGKRELIVFDDKLKGFGLRLQGKRRTWILQYRVKFKQRRLTLGSAFVYSPDQARKLAQQARREADDPQAKKQQDRERAKVTFRFVVDSYLKDRKPHLRPHSYYEVSRYLLEYWKAFHREPIDSIERKQIAARLRAIIESNGKIAAPAPAPPCRASLSGR